MFFVLLVGYISLAVRIIGTGGAVTTWLSRPPAKTGAWADLQSGKDSILASLKISRCDFPHLGALQTYSDSLARSMRCWQCNDLQMNDFGSSGKALLAMLATYPIVC